MGAAFPKVSYGPVTFKIKQGDTHTPIVYQTVDEFQQMVPILGATLLQFAYKLQTATGASTVKTATIVDPGNGNVMYQWAPGDTDVAGDYSGEWRVTFADGSTQKFPIVGFQPFTIEANLG